MNRILGETLFYEEDFTSMKSFDSHKIEEVTQKNINESGVDRLRIDQCKVFENFMKGSNLPIVAKAY